MIHEFKNPLPVITPMGQGYVLYVRDSGAIHHFHTDQLKAYKNATFDIEPK